MDCRGSSRLAVSESSRTCATSLARGGGPVWSGGGKLAADLTLPKLRHRWEPARVTPQEKFTFPERNAPWQLVAQTAAAASAQIRSHAATCPAAAAEAAWAADTLHAVAAALGSRVLRQAARLLAASGHCHQRQHPGAGRPGHPTTGSPHLTPPWLAALARPQPLTLVRRQHIVETSSKNTTVAQQLGDRGATPEPPSICWPSRPARLLRLQP